MSNLKIFGILMEGRLLKLLSLRKSEDFLRLADVWAWVSLTTAISTWFTSLTSPSIQNQTLLFI